MEHVVVRSKGSEEQLALPPGFRFHPTDEELITHYLSKKVLDANFNAMAIGEVDLNKCEPWDLPWSAKMAGEKEWYFFCVRDKKYPTGLRTNRATEAGYWKATGKDKDVHRRNILVGMKKTLVFYRGRAPKGEKTDWVMHEYSISNLPKTAKNEWVICRVYKKSSSSGKQTIIGMMKMEMGYSSSYSDELGVNDCLLPPLMDVHNYANQASNPAVAVAHVTCFSNTKEQEECSKTMKNMPDQSSNPVKNMNDHQDYINGSLMQLLQSNVSYSVIMKEEQEVGFKDQMVSKISQEMGFTNDDMNPEISSVNARVVPSTSSAALHCQDCLWGF